jgi:DNA invertase Pin-like site-specific DNA recombinase
MKTNKISSAEQFMQDIKMGLAKHYSKQLSENIKRGIMAKKLSTRAELPCKAV